MECPYLNCRSDNTEPGKNACPDCFRKLKICKNCSEPNRVMAVYCRECGKKLLNSDMKWPVYRGSSQRLGVSRFTLNPANTNIRIKEKGNFYLPDKCKSLLMDESYLYAFSIDGHIKIIDIFQKPPRESVSFNVGGPFSSEPALCNGSLYVGTGQGLQAYSLGILLSGRPLTKPRWEVPVAGIVREMLPVEIRNENSTKNRLLFTIKINNNRDELHAVDNIQSSKPDSFKVIDQGRLSSIAIFSSKDKTKGKKVYFLSRHQGNINLNRIDYSKHADSEKEPITIEGAPSEFKTLLPIAVIGARIFAVFTEKDTLCRLDADTGRCNQIAKNVKYFALPAIKYPVVVDSEGLFLPSKDRKAKIEKGQSVTCDPLILEDYAVVLGMRDGTIRLYDIHSPGLPFQQRVSEMSNQKITALAASGDIMAVGNDAGLVKTFGFEGR
ncbi:MAG: zinc ribbon domain-containing protein [Desulfobacteraceae bacterium]|nr:zinc ribbon domain-containing protein [Desulfobacteraceae bacterium]